MANDEFCHALTIHEKNPVGKKKMGKSNAHVKKPLGKDLVESPMIEWW
jgi:hypothetical protein